MSAEPHPMTGYTDTGTVPHLVARLYPEPHLACCGQPLVCIPLQQRAQDPEMVCRHCRRSDMTPLPYNHDPTKDIDTDEEAP